MLKAEDNALITRVGPGTPMGALFRRFWLPVMLPSELPEPDCPPVRLRVLGEDLVGFRDSQGRIGVLDAHCPHRRAHLFFGRNEECGLRCVYHGWKFDVEGRCVEMPSEPPETDFKHKVRTTAYPAREHGGFIWIYMGPEDSEPELPRLEWAEVPADHRWQSKWHYEANYLQGLEGEIDTTHTSYLHRHDDEGVVGRRMAQDFALWQRDRSPDLTIRPTDYGFFYGSRRALGEEGYNWRITQWLLPTFTLIPNRTGFPNSCRAYIPIDDERTMVLCTRYDPTAPLDDEEIRQNEEGLRATAKVYPGTFKPIVNRENDYMLDRAAQKTQSFTGIPGINNQDRALVETMGPVVDRAREHLGTSDKAVIAARQILLRLARDLENGIAPRAPSDGGLYAVRPIDVIDPAPDLDALLAGRAAELRAGGRV